MKSSHPLSSPIQPVGETAPQPLIASEIAIEGIDQPVILSYFQTLNAGEFGATSELFAVEGILQPPFEEAVEGRDAIAAYLQAEAKGLILQPDQGTSRPLENGCIEFQIAGKVQTAFFLVNICWDLLLSPQEEISLAKINLLASLQELLNLRAKR
ncbi:MAG: nuclear transport factor 2 family protein [Kovacikia sp.]